MISDSQGGELVKIEQFGGLSKALIHKISWGNIVHINLEDGSCFMEVANVLRLLGGLVYDRVFPQPA
jgi:hypothetical protein